MSGRRSPRRIRPRDPQITSRIMSSIRDRDSAAEMLLRREIWKSGLRYRLHVRKAAGEELPGRPDLVFVRPRVIVFIDSAFWHGRILRERGEHALAAQFRPARRAWWTAKISGNARRDDAVTVYLQNAGWHVMRFWDSDVLANPARLAAKVVTAVTKRQARVRHTRRRA